MDINEITLESLIQNTLIKHRMQDGEYYFSQKDLNCLYEDSFAFTPHVVFKWRAENNFWESGKFISFKEISEQIEHAKNRPSFGDSIDRMFGFDKK